MGTRTPTRLALFGGDKVWCASDWVASDDRVRGGRSHSYLKINNHYATFCGNLDIETLGGAGFASQRTTGDDRHWDLSNYDGIELLIDTARSDAKRYTFNLKDDMLPRDPDTGREQSTISWEYDFEVKQDSVIQDAPNLSRIVIPWSEFTPTYRGREKDPGQPLKLAGIQRISIMMRSFFGEQKGDFALCIASITATHVDEGFDGSESEARSIPSESSGFRDPKSSQPHPSETAPKSLWTRLLSICNKL